MYWLKRHSLILLIVWTLVILALSITPGNYLPKIRLELFSIDTFTHFSFYFGLSILSVFYSFKKNWIRHFALLIILAISVLYGGLIEIIQEELIPGRSFDKFDILSNSAGSVTGILVSKIIGLYYFKIGSQKT